MQAEITLYANSAQIRQKILVPAKKETQLSLPLSCVSPSIIICEISSGNIYAFEYHSPFAVSQIFNGPSKPVGEVINKGGRYEGTLLSMVDHTVTLKQEQTNQIIELFDVHTLVLPNYHPDANDLSINPCLSIPSNGANRDIELGYMMTNIQWKAFGTAMLTNNGKSMMLRLAAQINNQCGMKLIGNVTLITGHTSEMFHSSHEVQRRLPTASLRADKRQSNSRHFQVIQDDEPEGDVAIQLEDYKTYVLGPKIVGEDITMVELFQMMF